MIFSYKFEVFMLTTFFIAAIFSELLISPYVMRDFGVIIMLFAISIQLAKIYDKLNKQEV
jgi:hypothetical protein